jgi:hypothetical protein
MDQGRRNAASHAISEQGRQGAEPLSQRRPRAEVSLPQGQVACLADGPLVHNQRAIHLFPVVVERLRQFEMMFQGR